MSRIAIAKDMRDELLEFVKAEPSGLEWSRRYTEVLDEVVRAAYAEASGRHPSMSPVAIAAVGGYGLRQLSPWSDIDISLIPADTSDPALDAGVRDAYRELQHLIGDGLGLKLAYSYRPIADVPGLDAKSISALLTARRVAGAQEPFEAFERRLRADLPVASFLIAKLEERAADFAATNETPLATEPELKRGAGGLRCFQVANLIGLAMGQRPISPSPEYGRVLAMRNTLHAVCGRANDRLSYARRDEIAKIVGVDQFELGSRLALDLRSLHHTFREAREQIHESRFEIAPFVSALRGEVRFAANAPAADAALGVRYATELGLQVAEIAVVTTGKVDGPKAAQALRGGEAVLRNLDRCGVLGALLPELTATRTLMPRDPSHAYTVFEHTLRAVAALDTASNNRFESELLEDAIDMATLYLAVLLHDVGKIDHTTPHSETGGDIVQDLSDRWGLPERMREDLDWLVRNHLLVAKAVRMRDVARPETTEELAEQVGSERRLAALCLLTIVDIRAVAPEMWTQHQEAILKELYGRTKQIIAGESGVRTDPEYYKERIRHRLRDESINPETLREFVDSFPAHYLFSTPPEEVNRHFHMARRAKEGQPTVEIERDSARGISSIVVCCLDRQALLSDILGVLYALDISLVGLRASTAKGEPSLVLDKIDAVFAQKPLPPSTATRVKEALLAMLKGERTADELLRSSGKNPERRQQNFTHEYVEGSPGILEIQAPRGRGMPFRISRVISAQGWDVSSARVSQWAGNGAAAFYVSRPDGQLLTKEEVRAVFE